ncbi:hypothetical protein L9F63_007704, partial [Diploptera punctata]
LSSLLTLTIHIKSHSTCKKVAVSVMFANFIIQVRAKANCQHVYSHIMGSISGVHL